MDEVVTREQALQTLAEFAKTAPGRLPQRVQDAVAVAAAAVGEALQQFNLWGYWAAVDSLKSIGDGVSEATVTALGHAHVDERLEMGLSVGSRVLVRNDRLYGAGGPVLLVEPSGIIGHAVAP